MQGPGVIGMSLQDPAIERRGRHDLTFRVESDGVGERLGAVIHRDAGLIGWERGNRPLNGAGTAPGPQERSHGARAKASHLTRRDATSAGIDRRGPSSGKIGQPGPAGDRTPVFRNSGENDRMIRKVATSNLGTGYLAIRSTDNRGDRAQTRSSCMNSPTIRAVVEVIMHGEHVHGRGRIMSCARLSASCIVLRAIVAWITSLGPIASAIGVSDTCLRARNKANAATLAAGAGRRGLRNRENEPRICQTGGVRRRMGTTAATKTKPTAFLEAWKSAKRTVMPPRAPHPMKMDACEQVCFSQTLFSEEPTGSAERPEIARTNLRNQRPDPGDRAIEATVIEVEWIAPIGESHHPRAAKGWREPAKQSHDHRGGSDCTDRRNLVAPRGILAGRPNGWPSVRSVSAKSPSERSAP